MTACEICSTWRYVFHFSSTDIKQIRLFLLDHSGPQRKAICNTSISLLCLFNADRSVTWQTNGIFHWQRNKNCASEQRTSAQQAAPFVFCIVMDCSFHLRHKSLTHLNLMINNRFLGSWIISARPATLYGILFGGILMGSTHPARYHCWARERNTKTHRRYM